MRTPRLFTSQPLSVDAVISLDEVPANHLARVLRARLGDEVIVFNGDGTDYHGVVCRLERRHVDVKLVTAQQLNNESPLTTHLGLCISKGERFDWALQKATELGVSAITPLLSERVEVRIPRERLAKKHDHWRGVVRSGCEQCQRARVPEVYQPQSLTNWVANVEADAKLVLHHHKPAPLTGDKPRTAALLIGPEGGLSETEVLAAETAGFHRWCIGPRVLRTETAPVVALTALGLNWGDLD